MTRNNYSNNCRTAFIVPIITLCAIAALFGAEWHSDIEDYTRWVPNTCNITSFVKNTTNDYNIQVGGDCISSGLIPCDQRVEDRTTGRCLTSSDCCMAESRNKCVSYGVEVGEVVIRSRYTYDIKFNVNSIDLQRTIKCWAYEEECVQNTENIPKRSPNCWIDEGNVDTLTFIEPKFNDHNKDITLSLLISAGVWFVLACCCKMSGIVEDREHNGHNENTEHNQVQTRRVVPTTEHIPSERRESNKKRKEQKKKLAEPSSTTSQPPPYYDSDSDNEMVMESISESIAESISDFV